MKRNGIFTYVPKIKVCRVSNSGLSVLLPLPLFYGDFTEVGKILDFTAEFIYPCF